MEKFPCWLIKVHLLRVRNQINIRYMCTMTTWLQLELQLFYLDKVVKIGDRNISNIIVEMIVAVVKKKHYVWAITLVFAVSVLVHESLKSRLSKDALNALFFKDGWRNNDFDVSKEFHETKCNYLMLARWIKKIFINLKNELVYHL